jgi:hypothetical protein
VPSISNGSSPQELLLYWILISLSIKRSALLLHASSYPTFCCSAEFRSQPEVLEQGDKRSGKNITEQPFQKKQVRSKPRNLFPTAWGGKTVH